MKNNKKIHTNLSENSDDWRGGGRPGHDQPVVLRVVLGAETHGRGRRQQHKVSTEREENEPDPQRKQYLKKFCIYIYFLRTGKPFRSHTDDRGRRQQHKVRA